MNKTELIAKLKSAETGSPELSAEVFKYLNPEYKFWRLDRKNRLYSTVSQAPYAHVPPLTQSIDVAVKAVEEAGFEYRIDNMSKPYACLYKTVPIDGKDHPVVAASDSHNQMPIAICLALVEAMP